jgi:hypothetical protein
MPKAPAAATLVVRPMKWRADVECSAAFGLEPGRAEWALVMVSTVVKVLDGDQEHGAFGCTASAGASSWPSTLETK